MKKLDNKIKVFNFTMLRDSIAKMPTYKQAVSVLTKYAEKSAEDFNNLLVQKTKERDELHQSLGIKGLSQAELLQNIVHDIAATPEAKRESYIKKLAVVGEQIHNEIFASLNGVQLAQAA